MEYATINVEAETAKWATQLGLTCSSRLEPGVGPIPLSAQHLIFDLLPLKQIDVYLEAGELMRPRKSITFAQAIGNDMPVLAKRDICRQCRMHDSCRFKKCELDQTV